MKVKLLPKLLNSSNGELKPRPIGVLASIPKEVERGVVLQLPWIEFESDVEVKVPKVDSTVKAPLIVSRRAEIPNPVLKEKIIIKKVEVNSQPPHLS